MPVCCGRVGWPQKRALLQGRLVSVMDFFDINNSNKWLSLFYESGIGQSILHGFSHLLHPPVLEVQLCNFKLTC